MLIVKILKTNFYSFEGSRMVWFVREEIGMGGGSASVSLMVMGPQLWNKRSCIGNFLAIGPRR